VGKDNIQVTFENGNNSIGDYVVINLISPISGVIGTTTFRTGSNTGPIIWNGGIDPGVSVVNGLTDRFIFEATATSTSFISADLIGTK
jgi:hypothetical protein